MDRYFQHAQSGASNTHLHFQVPSVGQLAHVESKKRVASDRSKGAYVGIAHAIEQPDEEASDAARKQLVKGLPRSRSPRARDLMTKS
jgi:hypothetical protein